MCVNMSRHTLPADEKRHILLFDVDVTESYGWVLELLLVFVLVIVCSRGMQVLRILYERIYKANRNKE